MAMNIQARGDKFQLRVKHKVLPRAFFWTFATRDEAQAYGDRLEATLARGVVPVEIADALAKPSAHGDPLVSVVLDDYAAGNTSISDTDIELVKLVKPEFMGVRVGGITYAWAEDLVRRMKTARHLAPSTIRARIGLLGRVWQWYIATSRRNISNPWKMLPRGYSIANRTERETLEKAGRKVKRDEHRDRRLSDVEVDNIRRVLVGELLLERERGIAPDPELELLYTLIVDTGLRLREAYTLTRNRVDLTAGVIHAAGTKGHRGAAKPRDVPLKPALRKLLAAWLEAMPDGQDLLFPSLWDGDAASLTRATGRLSGRFATMFEHALCPDVTEHDLRHEATCRWLEMKNASGGYVFQETEVVKIMGWSSPALLLRYASIRGSDLADRLMEPATADR